MAASISIAVAVVEMGDVVVVALKETVKKQSGHASHEMAA